jgi:CheY-like chemotaxis protein
MPPLVALMDDLMFLSRIREAARGAELAVKSVRSAAELVAAAREGARLVLVDADSQRVPWQEALAALGAEPELREIPIVAFVSHVRPDLAQAARAAGASRVLARSAFVQELPGLVAGVQKAAVERPTGCATPS